MFNSHVLEVIAGLCFIFFVVSIFVSAVNEWISALLGLRAKDLETGLKNLLGDDVRFATPTSPTTPAAQAERAPAGATAAAPRTYGMATALLAHPLIANVSPIKVLEKKVTLPAYLDSSVFSSALLDLLLPGQGQHSLEELRTAVNSLANADLRDALLPLIDRAGGSIDRARKNIESWYDHAMEAVSGRYKRRAQLVMFLLGLAFAVGLNVNTLSATTHLWNDPVLRDHFLKQEQTLLTSSSACIDESAKPGVDPAQAEAAQRKKLKCSAQLVADAYSQAALPIGWSEDARNLWKEPQTALTVVFGWFLTALAACLGAPFWFDLLNKTLNLNTRLTGTKPKSAADPVDKSQSLHD
jgi:hypothetical protein